MICRGYIGVILRLYYGDYIGIVDKKVETTV